MTARLRSTSLLFAFFFLSSVATAHAECAWVLWENQRFQIAS